RKIVPAKRGPRSWSFWIALILFLMLGVSFLMNLGLLAVIGGSSSAGQARGSYVENVLESGSSGKIVLIEVKGVLMDQAAGGIFGGGPSIVERSINQLRQAQ